GKRPAQAARAGADRPAGNLRRTAAVPGPATAVAAAVEAAAATRLVAAVRRQRAVEPAAGRGAVLALRRLGPAGAGLAAVVGVRRAAPGRMDGLRGGRAPGRGARRLVVALVAHGRGRQDPGPAPAALAAGPLAGHGQPAAGHRRRRGDGAAAADPLPAGGRGTRAAGAAGADAGRAPPALVSAAAGQKPQ